MNVLVIERGKSVNLFSFWLNSVGGIQSNFQEGGHYIFEFNQGLAVCLHNSFAYSGPVLGACLPVSEVWLNNAMGKCK